MNHPEYVKRRQTIRARMRLVEEYLLDLADEGVCDCPLSEVRFSQTDGVVIIEAEHERYCATSVDRNVAAMEAGLKIERLFKQIGQSLDTSQTALTDGHAILANFHARRALGHLARCRDLSDRHGLDVPPGWDELATVLAGLERATSS